MTTEELRKINSDFNDRLGPLIMGNNADFNPLELGNPCLDLLEAGMPDLPIQMSVRRLVDKKLQTNHPFKIVSVVHMPECLAEPIAVFRSKTRGDSIVVLTDMIESDINFVVAIELNKLKGMGYVNDIRSVYPKDNIMDILRWIAVDNLLEKCNKEKILDWIGKQQSNSAEVTNLIKDSTKVINSI